VRGAIVLLACAATVLAGAGEARATNECRGLMVCVPVAGPWVIVPATRHVQYQVACPRSYVIGGLDADGNVTEGPGFNVFAVKNGVVLTSGHGVLEGVSRRDFSMKVKEKMLLAGFALLLTLMVTVIYNDLTRIQWIERLMPWR